MKIERINENSISCTLTSFDLSVRNLNLRELAYGSEKAKKLFEEMMSKASTEVGFNADNTPIMIEAIPLSSDSIKLIISKVTDPEELDTRFSRFTQNPNAVKKDGDSWINKLTSILLEGSDGFAEQLKKLKQAAEDQNTETKQAPSDSKEESTGSEISESSDAVSDIPSNDYRAFAFGSLDLAISASKAAAAFTGESTLYKSPIDGRYVLVVRCIGTTPEDFSKTCNVIAEYGRMIKTVQNTLSYYEEHYKLIIADGAVGKLAGI